MIDSVVFRRGRWGLLLVSKKNGSLAAPMWGGGEGLCFMSLEYLILRPFCSNYIAVPSPGFVVSDL